MLYLVSEIVLSLALAALLGIAFGWLLRATIHPSRRRVERPDRRQAQEIARLEARLREVGPESMLLEPRVAELEAALADARGEADAALARVDELSAENEELRGSDGTESANDRVSQLEAQIEALRGRAEAAENRLVAFARDQTEPAPRLAAAAEAEDGGAAERLHEAQSRIAALQNELFAQEARFDALREQMARLRDEARRAVDELAAERESHAETTAKLEELGAVHADCDFAFSALRDKILLLRSRVSELESHAVSDDEPEQRLGNGTSGL